jgi:hypothetical protein
MNHIVQFSGGICSWCTAKRVIERHDNENIVLLFADTLIEDQDTYRFINESSLYFDIPITRLADGRDPWQVFEDEKFIGNSRIDPCSKILKRELLSKYMQDNYDPADTIIHFGLDWTEIPRFERIRDRKKPWECRAYMIEKPWLLKTEMLKELTEAGIEIPRLYKLGFKHNNCGGFCVKAGQAQFAHLLRTLPDRYREHEENELRLRSLGINGTILSITRNGIKQPITLRDFRVSIEQNNQYDREAWGGCGCAIDE